MNEQDPSMRRARLHREALLLRYADALERADHDAIARLLNEAQMDAVTENALWEWHLTLHTEQAEEEARAQQRTSEQDATLVREMAASHFNSPVTATPPSPPVPEPPPPPLTVGDVAADLRGRVGANEQTRTLLSRLEQSTERIGEDVSLRAVRTLLQRLGLGNAGRRFVDMFHDAAFALNFQRQQWHVLQLAATRRQHKRGEYGQQEQHAPAEHVSRIADEATAYQPDPEHQKEDGA